MLLSPYIPVRVPPTYPPLTLLNSFTIQNVSFDLIDGFKTVDWDEVVYDRSPALGLSGTFTEITVPAGANRMAAGMASRSGTSGTGYIDLHIRKNSAYQLINVMHTATYDVGWLAGWFSVSPGDTIDYRTRSVDTNSGVYMVGWGKFYA